MADTQATIQALREERVRLVEQGRRDLEAREAKADWNDEDEANWTRRIADAEALGKRIALMERQRDLEAGLHEGRRSTPDPIGTGIAKSEDAPGVPVTQTPEYRAAFGQYLTDRRMAPILAHGYVEGSHAPGWQTQAANSIGSDVDGGYLVTPVEMVQELIKTYDDELFLYQWARKFPLTKSRSLGVPTRTAKASSAAWGSEVQEPTADTALKFGGRELNPHFYAGEIKVSRPFLQTASLSPESIINDEILRDSGELLEDAFLTGTGSGQPLGVFTASASGISTARDVSTGNLSTEMTIDGLKECKGSLKFTYQRKAKFLTSRQGHTQLAKIKDGEGRYYWQDSIVAGEPDRILNMPAFVHERCPNTFTSGLYVAIMGDFDKYWVAQGLDLEIYRANELLIRSNQVAFIYRGKVDAMPVLEEAFARVKLG